MGKWMECGFLCGCSKAEVGEWPSLARRTEFKLRQSTKPQLWSLASVACARWLQSDCWLVLSLTGRTWTGWRMWLIGFDCKVGWVARARGEGAPPLPSLTRQFNNSTNTRPPSQSSTAHQLQSVTIRHNPASHMPLVVNKLFSLWLSSRAPTA